MGSPGIHNMIPSKRGRQERERGRDRDRVRDREKETESETDRDTQRENLYFKDQITGEMLQ